jgi:hypothetical protein
MIACVFFAAGCKKKGTVSFCEGVDKGGKGVNCGTEFSTGDMTAVFNSRSAFDTDSLEMKIFNAHDASRKPAATIAVKVNPSDRDGHVDLEMYDEGVFRVEVRKHGGEVVSEGQVEIVDTYVKP